MASRRLARLNEQLKRELSDIIRTEVADPRVGLVTVTGVDASPDLYSAKVWIRTLGEEEEQEEAVEGLKAAAAYIRRELGQRMRTRRVPELHFEFDPTLDRAMRIEAILDEVRPEEGWEEGEGGEESDVEGER